MAIAAGECHSLGLKLDGSSSPGETTVQPVRRPGPNAGFVAVAGGGQHSLGLYDPAGVRVEQPWQPDPDQDLQKPPAVRLINQPNPFNPNTEIRYWMEGTDA